MKMTSLLTPLLAGVLAAGVWTGYATSKTETFTGAPVTAPEQKAMTPAQALERLREGNARFVAGTPARRDLPHDRAATAGGQNPFAVVLSCLDSRTSSELIFDQGLGDVFNARIAGNVLNDDILGSMEFACKVAGAKLIAVVGHTKCGAVKGACTGVEMGNLTGLLAKMRPAVEAVPAPADKGDSKHVDAVAAENVKLVMAQIKERSPILAEMIRDGKIALAGGMYDLQSGKVTFIQ